jgi:hypothetical protein
MDMAARSTRRRTGVSWEVGRRTGARTGVRAARPEGVGPRNRSPFTRSSLKDAAPLEGGSSRRSDGGAAFRAGNYEPVPGDPIRQTRKGNVRTTRQPRRPICRASAASS